MSNRVDFYRERDRRTREYGATEEACFEQPVILSVGADAADSPGGQLAAMATMNMVSRLHRQVCLICPGAPLLVPRALLPVQSPEHMSLADALATMATAIDPYIRVDLPVPSSAAPGIAIGAATAVPVPWYIGCADSMVRLDAHAIPMGIQAGFSLGACLASCIAAGTLFKQVLGRPVAPLDVSAWNLQQSPQAERGPAELGPINVGNVAMIGAGGVGSGLAYWLRQSGVCGTWQVIDGDLAELHNTNRSLGLVAADAGWPDRPPRSKAVVAADLFGAAPAEHWFDELDQNAIHPDLILPLANERGIRSAISQRGEPLVLHATTSLTWEAQLHRHVAGRDDCIMCRMPARAGTVKLECSTVPLGGVGTPPDAAMPFLSATAGFLLVNGLYRLMSGDLGRGDLNLWRVMYNSSGRFTRFARCRCQTGCVGIPNERVRGRIHAGRRWAHLDAVCGSRGQA